MKGKIFSALLTGLFATSFIPLNANYSNECGCGRKAPSNECGGGRKAPAKYSNDCGACDGKGHSNALLDGSCDKCKKGR